MEPKIMKMLITGITGFLGRHLCAYYAGQNGVDLFGTGRSAHPHVELPGNAEYLQADITNREEILTVLDKIQPDVIIHTAAMSSPNVCEVEQDLTRKVNVDATRYLAEWAKEHGAHFLHLSTDFVFGDHGPFSEEDTYGPVNFYGQSKVEAEQAIMETGGRWAIIRPVLIYGYAYAGGHGSFPQWVKGELEAGNHIRVFTDQYRTATYVDDLVWGIDQIIRKEKTGKWHLCGPGIITPYHFALQIAVHLGLDQNLISPVTSGEMQELAKRPVHSTLHISKAQNELGFSPVFTDEGLKKTFK